jgi:methylated-DNA-protein-cysteine methyltransferase-like protein
MPESDALSFAQRVYEVVRRIPVGRVTTYGAIARSLGSPRSARIVGYVLRMAPTGHDLPAHRVLNRVGYLSGGWHFGHPDVMRSELEDEGVEVNEEYVVDLARYFWDPADDPDVDALFRIRY